MKHLLLSLFFVSLVSLAEESISEADAEAAAKAAATTKTDNRTPGGTASPSPSPSPTAAAVEEKVEDRMLSSIPSAERVKPSPEKEAWDLKLVKEFFTKATQTENPALTYSKCKPLTMKELKNEEGWVGVRGSLDKETQTWAISGSSILYINPALKEGAVTYTPGIADFEATPEDFVGKLQTTSRMNLVPGKSDISLSLISKLPFYDHHEVTIRKYPHPSGKVYYVTQDVHKLQGGRPDPDIAIEYGIFSANRINPEVTKQ